MYFICRFILLRFLAKSAVLMSYYLYSVHIHRNNIICICCCVWILCREYSEFYSNVCQNLNVISCGRTETKIFCWHRSSNASQSNEKQYQLIRSIHFCSCTKVDVQCGILGFQHVLVHSMWEWSFYTKKISGTGNAFVQKHVDYFGLNGHPVGPCHVIQCWRQTRLGRCLKLWLLGRSTSCGDYIHCHVLGSTCCSNILRALYWRIL